MKQEKEKIPAEFANSKQRREKRQDEAHARQMDRETRTPKQQLALLDKRLGKGVGAKRERERLALLIG